MRNNRFKKIHFKSRDKTTLSSNSYNLLNIFILIIVFILLCSISLIQLVLKKEHWHSSVRENIVKILVQKCTVLLPFSSSSFIFYYNFRVTNKLNISQ